MAHKLQWLFFLLVCFLFVGNSQASHPLDTNRLIVPNVKIGSIYLGITAQTLIDKKEDIHFTIQHILYVKDKLVCVTTNTGGSVFLNEVHVGYPIDFLFKKFGPPHNVFFEVEYEYTSAYWFIWDDGLMARVLLGMKDDSIVGAIQQLGVYTSNNKKDVIQYLIEKEGVVERKVGK